VTLASLLEQMGLASPTRYVYVLHDWDPSLFTYPSRNDDHIVIAGMPIFYESDPSGMDPGAFGESPGYVTNFVAGFNFDPQTFETSVYINNTGYAGDILFYNAGQKYIEPFAFDPLANTYTAVADSFLNLNAGGFYTGLTYDDVGGLRYLLSADNVNYERLLLDIRTFCPHRNGIGNGAWRPGVEKITFVRQPSDRWSRKFRPLRYHFTDVYLKNNVLLRQRAEREIRQPDFLFCVADTGENNTNSYTPWVICPGTTDWLNNAALNGNTNGEGPGVIQPPIKITFHKLGAWVLTDDSGSPGEIDNEGWGSFDGSTNLPVVYPPDTQPNNRQMTIRLRFFDTDFSPAIQLTNVTWHLQVPIGGQASLQISANQIDWTALASVINSGSVIEWHHNGTDNPPKFFRAIPQ
jgi:hypothetical protein